jgi:hypothetical protein
MKHLKYLNYVIRHKWFVFLAGIKTQTPFWQLLIHDWSKFLPSEWLPYVNNFYASEDEKFDEWSEANTKYGCQEAAPYGHFIKDRFTVAWLHHQNRNKHHWQYWVITKDDGRTFALPMPEKYVREMVADWAGAGKAITGEWEVAEWYEKNRAKMMIAPESEFLVNELMGEFIENGK